ncbi:large subunit ribosomal protein L10Ae [Enteropsectra breve]|nr:large subunit ribosomal protein L10Ae [Enteropsectra breve]
MANTVDERMRKVTFLKDEDLVEKINQIRGSVDKNETIQVQLSIKGYENRKDPKMTKDIVFPHIMRRDPSVCVIGNESVKAEAEKLNIPFILSSEYEGKANDKAKEKIIKKYKYFIMGADYQKAFNLRDILKKKKTHFMCPKTEQLKDLYESVLVTYRLRIKDWFAVSFPVGHCEMPVDQVLDNMKVGVQFLADNLKKGAQNIKECYIKRTTGESLRVY